ncbi:MAG: radical SAM/SPASM domain-containing protein [Nitrospinales bacterium]
MTSQFFPQRINIEPTNFCNQKCHFCPRNEMERPVGNMELDLFKKIIDDLAGRQVKVWLHFMGEPLLNPALFDMIEFAKSRNVSEVGLSTNASFLKGKNKDRLLAAPLDRLEFSLDALDRSAFLKMRGVDEFEKVRDHVVDFLRTKYASKKKTPVTSIQFMRTEETLESQREIVAAWKPLLEDDDFIMMIDEFSFVDFSRRTPTGQNRERTPCDWLWKYMVILWNGDAPICLSDYDGTDVLGNVKNESIADIWNGEKINRYRRHHLNLEFGEIANCANCDVWKSREFEGREVEGYTNILTG